MKELDDVLDFLEAQIPANPNSPKALKLADDLERELKKYFKQFHSALPQEKLEGIYYKYVEQG